MQKARLSSHLGKRRKPTGLASQKVLLSVSCGTLPWGKGLNCPTLYPFDKKVHLSEYLSLTNGTYLVTQAIGLYLQNNNFARASCFFVHFLTVVARLQSESA